MRAEKAKYTAIVGTDAKLVCTGEDVIDDDDTSLSWVFNGTEIKNTSDHYRVTTDFIEPDGLPKVITQLSVLNVRYADSGNYGCRIVNWLGRVVKSDTIRLEVKTEGTCRKPFILISAHVSAKMSKNAMAVERKACCHVYKCSL